MKTLLLLSQFDKMQNWIIAFLRDREAQNIIFIIDAKKPRLKEDKNYIFKDKITFQDAGFKVTLIDLEASNKENLKSVLKAADAVYVKGGNSFYLLNAMRKSGFDELAGEFIEKGLLYIGESAGAYVACPTIDMADWKQQDKNIVGLEDLTGLNLVPYLISAHYQDNLLPIIEPHIKASKYEVKLLTDSQLILVDNGSSQLISL